MPESNAADRSSPEAPVGTPPFVSLVVGEQAERLPVTTFVTAYYWACQECGWLGSGLLSLTAAMQEAGAHWDKTHGGPLVAPPLVERRDAA